MGLSIPIWLQVVGLLVTLVAVMVAPGVVYGKLIEYGRTIGSMSATLDRIDQKTTQQCEAIKDMRSELDNHNRRLEENRQRLEERTGRLHDLYVEGNEDVQCNGDCPICEGDE